MNPVANDLARLVAFPTVSDRPITELSAFLAGRLEDLGFRIERFGDPVDPGKHNLVASIGPAGDADGTDGLVLSGHMDVVPTEGQPWSTDPFVATVRDGRMYGRGTADMKGFFAATLQALARIPKTAWRRELVLAWTYDEEIGCFGSAHLARALASEGRRVPSACLIGEPTDFRILRMHAGHVAVELTFTGKAAHSSRPRLGVNAIELAAEAIGEVRALALDLEPGADGDPLPVNIARIDGGSAVNIVPDRCVVTLGYRPPPGMRDELVYERIRERLARFPVSVRLVRVTPSLQTAEGTPLQTVLADYASEPGTGSAAFATDGGNLCKIGCQPLVFGPGSIDVAHKADEYVELAQLDRAVHVVEQVVRARCT